jgi:hypothetical protein
MKGKLPDIRIVPIGDLVLHEKVDPGRIKRIADRLESDGLFKNPVIVGKVKNSSKFIHVDGAHRIGAAKKISLKHLIVQVIDYFSEDVKVYSWHHLIRGFDRDTFIKKIKDIEGVELEKTDRETSETLLKQNKIVASLFFKNGDIFVIKSKDDLRTRATKLVEVVEVYSKASEIGRTIDSEVDFVLKEDKDLTAILLIPTYEKKDIVELAFSGIELPTGTTRHVIPERALGLNIDLSLLKSDKSTEKKNRILREIIEQRIKEKKTRYYPEPTYVFNE